MVHSLKALFAKIGGRASRSTASGNPRVIGATGGSGTRVMARLTRRGGTFIGTLLNEFEDAINIGLFLNDWIPPYIESEHQGVPMPPATGEEMIRQFHAALARHLEPMADRSGPYGWKEPRSIYLLPFFHARFPDMRFLHLIRDGRDMAFSANQNQLNKYGISMIPPELTGWPRPVQSIALWSRSTSGRPTTASRECEGSISASASRTCAPIPSRRSGAFSTSSASKAIPGSGAGRGSAPRVHRPLAGRGPRCPGGAPRVRRRRASPLRISLISTVHEGLARHTVRRVAEDLIVAEREVPGPRDKEVLTRFWSSVYDGIVQGRSR